MAPNRREQDVEFGMRLDRFPSTCDGLNALLTCGPWSEIARQRLVDIQFPSIRVELEYLTKKAEGEYADIAIVQKSTTIALEAFARLELETRPYR